MESLLLWHPPTQWRGNGAGRRNMGEEMVAATIFYWIGNRATGMTTSPSCLTMVFFGSTVGGRGNKPRQLHPVTHCSKRVQDKRVGQLPDRAANLGEAIGSLPPSPVCHKAGVLSCPKAGSTFFKAPSLNSQHLLKKSILVRVYFMPTAWGR